MDCVWIGIGMVIGAVIVSGVAHLVTRHRHHSCSNCRYYSPVSTEDGLCQMSMLNGDIIKALNLTIPKDSLCEEYERKEY